MLRTTSRTLATLLGVALVLALATPVSAQKEKRTQRSRPSSIKASSSAKVKKASPTRSRTARTTATALKSQSGTQANRTRYTVRVNRAADSKTRSGRVATAFRSQATISQLKGTPNPRDRDRYRDLYRRPQDDGRDADRERYEDMYRRPPDDGRDRDSDRGDRDYDRDGRRRDRDGRDYGRNDRRRYDSGYTYGYDRGYHRGYHRGVNDGRYNRHRHYYGRHLVYGYHYGGFGFYNGRWHFAIVIGSPIIVRHRYNYYRYSWWDGYGTSLYTWDRAAQMYPASYNFDMSDRSCIALWISTTDGADYEIKVDPRYYNARDPGDLYAALWTELERQGQLQIEDVNGAVHIFPAGMIQQIEARGCN